MQHLRIYRDVEIDFTGVTRIWRWECNHFDCIERTVDYGEALYWENALRSVNNHIKWHKANIKAG